MDYSTFYNQISNKLNKKDLDYLKSSKYPDCILEFYKHKEPQNCVEINGARLWSINNLKVENEDGVPVYVIYDLGYRAIGTTIYGDVYCLNVDQLMNNGQPFIYILSHDEIEDDEEYTNDEILSKIIKVADSFNEFLEKFIEGTLRIHYFDV